MALTLLVAPIVGLVAGTAIALCLSILVFIVIDEESARHPPAWLNPTTIWLPRISVLLAMLVTTEDLLSLPTQQDADSISVLVNELNNAVTWRNAYVKSAFART